MNRRVLIASVAVIALFGCESATSQPDAGATEGGVGARIELGTGRLTVEPLVGTTPEIELVSGPQGGWHLDLTLRLFEIPRERLELEYRVERVTDGLVLCRTPIVVSSAGLVQRDGHVERLADRAILDIAASADVIGEQLRVRATVRLADGRMVRDERIVQVIDRIAEL